MKGTGTSLGLVIALVGAAAALAAPGDLDPGFDGDGRQIVDFGGNDVAWDVAVDSQRRIVSAGFTISPTYQFAVSRLTPTGAPDFSFSGDGKQTVAFTPEARGEALAIQADGKIVVVGGSVAGNDLTVARLTAAGELDPEFGADGNSDGMQTYPGWSYGEDVVLQPDGKILIVATGVDPAGGTTSDYVVTRLLPNGAPDTDFSGDGRAFVDFGAVDNAFALALQPDGRIVAVGAAYAAGNTASDIGVARLLPTGLLDPDFPNRQVDIATLDFGLAVLIQGDGRIVVAGENDNDMVVARLNENGTPDDSFDGDSKRTVDFGGEDYAYEVLQQANGKLVLAGDTSIGENMAVARLQPGGALDTTFHADGKQTVEFGATDGADAAALQRDGEIVLAGYGAGGNFALARVEGEPPVPGGPGGPGGGGPGGGGPGGGGGVAPRCGGKRATIVGTARSELLRGSRRADVIVALGGNDRVVAAGGNDVVCAGAGNDRVAGGAGSDRLLGGAGNDTIAGDAGNDKLAGDAGNDKLAGSAGRDTLGGGAGKDALSGGGGKDRLAGGGGRDSCLGGSGADRASCERKRSI
jgi:uncharacterized delta-60 repeat protein